MGKETPRMPPEWKKSTNCFRLFIYKSKDLILDINSPNNVFSPYLTLPIMASFFVSGKPIHTLGCVVSEYMCQKKEKYTQSLSAKKKKKKKKKTPNLCQQKKKKKKKKKS